MKAFVLMLYHQGQSTVARITAMLRAMGMPVSCRKVLRILNEDSAGLVAEADEIKVLQALAWKHGFCKARDPPAMMTMERFVVLTAGLAGFHPSKRQPLPGTQKLWEGLQILSTAVFGHRAYMEWETQGKHE